jgi:H(+)-translocating pyrophosphatase
MSVISMTDIPYIVVIYGSCLIALVWAAIQATEVNNIEVAKPTPSAEDDADTEPLNQKQAKTNKKLAEIGGKISDGANAFLFAEYKVMSIFTVLFAILIYVIVDVAGARSGTNVKYFPYATFAFVIGAFTSVVCGFLGMRIAVIANFRVTFKAQSSLGEAFSTAYRAGCVMGFATVGISLVVLASLMLVYMACYEPSAEDGAERSYETLMDLIAGYGLGGSSMALFGRVGGGIYTKAADVGADLVGKVEQDLPEDSPKNPGTIADNVGDNVGDIAGMGSDLFGSFAESTCAALILITSNKNLFTPEYREVIWYPLMISAVGILASLVTSVIGISVYKVKEKAQIQKALNLQLWISTGLVLIGIWVLSPFMLPPVWLQEVAGSPSHDAYWYHPAICATMGLISGFLIGMATDYYTSNSHSPVQELAQKCTSGAAINIIYGLAVGYLSTIIPIVLLAITIIVATKLLGMLGVALAAIGMLSTLAVGLAIDAYGPISDNAGGIAEMCECEEHVREYTDALDAAGNTTAAVGKGFAIGSAALVSLALYGAFITRAQHSMHNKLGDVQVIDGWVFGSMLIGAMLPYWFSALTMKSVGRAAEKMVVNIRMQFQKMKDDGIKLEDWEPDFDQCIQISTNASLKEMIAPAMLVMLTPILAGVIFGTKVVAGILPGALLSGVQLAVSMSNTGGAWDNAKKFIESGNLKGLNGETLGKGTEEHKAAVIGDTVGDPLKDTSGPSLNILIKLMAIISLVFANGFSETSWLAGPFGINSS